MFTNCLSKAFQSKNEDDLHSTKEWEDEMKNLDDKLENIGISKIACNEYWINMNQALYLERITVDESDYKYIYIC